MQTNRRPFTITKLQRGSTGWEARVSCDGTTVEVDRRDGSWLATVRTRPKARTFDRREVLPHVAAELQRKVRRLEKREGVAA